MPRHALRLYKSYSIVNASAPYCAAERSARRTSLISINWPAVAPVGYITTLFVSGLGRLNLSPASTAVPGVMSAGTAKLCLATPRTKDDSPAVVALSLSGTSGGGRSGAAGERRR